MADLRLASTVLILRQIPSGLQLLLLRRNAKLAFAGGAWVFPGGAVDSVDSDNFEGMAQEEASARSAAVRECEEECGLILQPQQLVHFAHWTTPENQRRRFATWFFVASVDQRDCEVVIDDGEIHDYQWLSPRQALALHRQGELDIMPPTYISIKLLEQFSTSEEALQRLALTEPYWVIPRVARDGGAHVLLYPGDAGYEACDASLSGPRHRTLLSDEGVHYIHSGKDVGVAAMDKAEEASKA